MSNNATPGKKITGLDSLRLIAALCVALFHGARLPLDKILDGDGFVEKALVAGNNIAFNGVAAVMVFFVISGFVIHLPQVGRDSLDIKTFLVRRLLRVAIPVAVGMLLGHLLGARFSQALDAVLWSLYCELAYYAAYPLVFEAIRRGHLNTLLAASATVSFAIIVYSWPSSYFWNLSWPMLIVLGFFNWLLGCVLAEQRARREAHPDPGRDIWLWRIGAFVLAVLLKIPVTHGPLLVGFPASHWVMAVYAYFWVDRELDYFSHRPAWTLLEAGGIASFSLYLIHNFVIVGFDLMYRPTPPLGNGLTGWLLSWLVQLLAIAAATTLFYRLVEKPSHGLARALSVRIGTLTRPTRESA